MSLLYSVVPHDVHVLQHEQPADESFTTYSTLSCLACRLPYPCKAGRGWRREQSTVTVYPHGIHKSKLIYLHVHVALIGPFHKIYTTQCIELLLPTIKTY